MLIYLITCKSNNKQYVGMTSTSLNKRMSSHFSKKTTNGAPLLKRAILKYGRENFTVEVIDTADCIKDLIEKEKFWIKEKNTQAPNGYNITSGGIGGANLASIEVHKKPILCVNDGKIYASIKDAANKYDLRHSSVSRVCRGDRDSTKGFRFEFIDKEDKLKAEYKKIKRRKNRESKKDRIKISGYEGARKRFESIKCLETGEEFESFSMAAKKMNLFHANIIKVAKGKQNSTGGYSFEYCDPKKRADADVIRETRIKMTKQNKKRKYAKKIIT